MPFALSAAHMEQRNRPGPSSARLPGRSRLGVAFLLLDNREQVARRQNEVILVVVLDLGAAVLAVQHHVAYLDVERNPLFAVFVEASGTDGEDDALLGLFLRRVRDYQARRRGLLGIERLDHDPVLEWLEGNLRGGRHDLDLPLRRCLWWVRSRPAGSVVAGARPASSCWHPRLESANPEH